MGLRMRKSINLGGGLRVNISKSGIGYSWGVPGYRITKTATGKTRKTYSIPGTGLSYVEENGKNKPPKATSFSESKVENEKVLDSGEIAEYQGVEYQELLEGIKNFKKWNRLSTILILTLLLSPIPVFALSGIIGIALKIYVRKNLAIAMNYSFDNESRANYEEMKDNWNKHNTSKSLWQLTTSVSTSKQKYHAGATNLVERKKIKISEKCPIFFKSETKYITLHLKNEDLILMPDKVLVIKGKEVGAISYEEVSIKGSEYRFIEQEKVPADAEIIDHTWTKVNKDGSPDKRFKGNRKLPICRYGLIQLTTNSGMDVRICCSNYKLIDSFT